MAKYKRQIKLLGPKNDEKSLKLLFFVMTSRGQILWC